MKNRITEQERLQLLGLMTLAIQHQKIVNECETALATLLENDPSEGSYVGQLSDAIYNGDDNIDNILKEMDIKIIK